MATFDIFNNDAFSVSRLTQTIVDIPRVPTLLGDLGLFTEQGIDTPTMMIERTGASLNLVPAAPRGGVGNTISRDGRKLVPVAAVHLPQRGALMADEIYGVRAFGSETEVEQMTTKLAGKFAKMKANIDLTLEYHRIGAIKGQVLDADGTTVLLDVYSLFGKTQDTQFWNIASATSTIDPKQWCVNLKRKIRNALGGRPFTRVRAVVSEAFFDCLIAHNAMKKAWDLWNQGQFYRTDQANATGNTADFEFAGVVFTIYSGGTSAGDFIDAGLGYAFPEGVPGLFGTWYAPADYMETVNTQGVPYYAKQELMSFNKGVELESQSNPINLCTLPETVIKLSTAAS